MGEREGRGEREKRERGGEEMSQMIVKRAGL